MSYQFRKKYIHSFLSAILTSSGANASEFPPLEKLGALQYAGCPDGPRAVDTVEALDASKPMDVVTLSQAKIRGINTIIRYFDWSEIGRKVTSLTPFGPRSNFNRSFTYPWRPGPQFNDKGLTIEEVNLIHKKGFRGGIVFQHFYSDLRTFLDFGRATYDANRVVEAAQDMSVPTATTIFFGIDLDADSSNIKYISRYMQVAGEIVRSHGYNVGVYGNGFVCKRLLDAKQASSCWLSQSIGFNESQGYAGTGNWDLKQCATRRAFPGSKVSTSILLEKETGSYGGGRHNRADTRCFGDQFNCHSTTREGLAINLSDRRGMCGGTYAERFAAAVLSAGSTMAGAEFVGAFNVAVRIWLRGNESTS
jgi:hypothetical protein